MASAKLKVWYPSDWLIGDNVMRSLYTVYDFGDYDSSGKMGNPYMQLLALVDPNTASKEFHSDRGGSASTNISYNAQSVSATGAAAGGGTTTVTVSDKLADTLTKLQTYIPAVLAIMALNALVILVLAAAGIVYMCRRHRRSRSARTRRTPGRATPMLGTAEFDRRHAPAHGDMPLDSPYLAQRQVEEEPTRRGFLRIICCG